MGVHGLHHDGRDLASPHRAAQAAARDPRLRRAVGSGGVQGARHPARLGLDAVARVLLRLVLRRLGSVRAHARRLLQPLPVLQRGDGRAPHHPAPGSHRLHDPRTDGRHALADEGGAHPRARRHGPGADASRLRATTRTWSTRTDACSRPTATTRARGTRSRARWTRGGANGPHPRSRRSADGWAIRGPAAARGRVRLHAPGSTRRRPDRTRRVTSDPPRGPEDGDHSARTASDGSRRRGPARPRPGHRRERPGRHRHAPAQADRFAPRERPHRVDRDAPRSEQRSVPLRPADPRVRVPVAARAIRPPRPRGRVRVRRSSRPRSLSVRALTQERVDVSSSASRRTSTSHSPASSGGSATASCSISGTCSPSCSSRGTAGPTNGSCGCCDCSSGSATAARTACSS